MTSTILPLPTYHGAASQGLSQYGNKLNPGSVSKSIITIFVVCKY